MRPSRLLALGLVGSLVGCQSRTTYPPHLPASAATLAAPEKPRAPELTFHLTAGTPETVAPDPPLARPLAAAATRALLAALPALPPLPAPPAIALRPDLPPPSTGQVALAFPPVASTGAGPPAQRPAPLTVERITPDGRVDLAPRVTVTFSQAMDPLAPVPVTVSPMPAGASWRWLGARTCVLELGERLPMATRYQVEVPAGATSVAGGRLARSFKQSFTTPAPRLRRHWPEYASALQPVIFMRFDQAIEPARVLAATHLVTAAGPLPVRLATAAEIAADQEVTAQVKDAPAGRWLALVPQVALPRGTVVQVVLGPGLPSAEGPERALWPVTWSFTTHGDLAVAQSRCGSQKCFPGDAFEIQLSNPIDPASLEKNPIILSPGVPDMDIWVSQDTLVVRGSTHGQTRYTVTLPAGLTDVFGQPLGEARAVGFTVERAPPAFEVPGPRYRVLEPGEPLAVTTINVGGLVMRASRIEPGDWAAYLAYRDDAQRGLERRLPGHQVEDTVVEVDGTADERQRTELSLPGKGLYAVHVQPLHGHGLSWDGLVNVTGLGLSLYTDDERAVAWVTRLADGAPAAGATVGLEQATGESDADGLVRLPLPAAPGKPRLVWARLGDDLAVLPEEPELYGGGESAWRSSGQDRLAWYATSDRGIYKPGETAHWKGWLRRLGRSLEGDLSLPGPAVTAVSWKASDARGNAVGAGKAVLSAAAGFELALPIPELATSGPLTLTLRAEGPGAGALEQRELVQSVSVQAFRTPEFEVTTSLTTPRPLLVGGQAELAVDAGYYTGGGLGGAPVVWQVSSEPGTFHPPGHDDYSFGATASWYHSPDVRLEGHTDPSGRHLARLELQSMEGRPVSLTAVATVEDVNRQAWTSEQRLIIHPATRYAGLRTERGFYRPGEPIVTSVIASDLDGQLTDGVSVALELLQGEATVDRTTCTSGATCQVMARRGGFHLLRATIADAQGRHSLTERGVWVEGGEERTADGASLQLMADRDAYVPGDTARILVQAPFADGDALVTIRRHGLAEVRRFTMQGKSQVLAVPVVASGAPTIEVGLELVGKGQRFARGGVSLRVWARDRELGLTIAPPPPGLAPGQEGQLSLAVTDPDGNPLVGAEIAVAVVDEAVLDLVGHDWPDPLGVFRSAFYGQMQERLLRNSLMVSLPAGGPVGARGAYYRQVPGDVTKATGDSSGGKFEDSDGKQLGPRAAEEDARREISGGERDSDGSPSVSVRLHLSALALFAPTVVSDASGRAVVPFTLPGTLTRYRVFAVAAHGARRFGKATASLTASLPLMVRPQAPRYLNLGDHIELPVMVHNQAGQPLTVEVGLRADNAVIAGEPGRSVRVPAGGQAEVRFPLAPLAPGPLRLQAVARAGKLADAAQLTVPVWTPGTSETFATTGELDAGSVVLPLGLPASAWPDYGSVDVSTSTSLLGSLGDAYNDLLEPTHDGTFAIASRILAIASQPAPGRKLIAAAEGEVSRLYELQQSGCYGRWRRDEPMDPFVSVHVIHAVARARQRGWRVPEDLVTNSINCLNSLEQSWPESYGPEARRSTLAYALMVRERLGKGGHDRARQLAREPLSVDGAAWLLWTLSGDPAAGDELTRLRRFLTNRVQETAAMATVATDLVDEHHVTLGSSHRSDAIVLEALVKDQRESEVVGKLVRGLLAHRKDGHWLGASETVFVLLALAAYGARFEATPPELVARIWMANGLASEQALRGRTGQVLSMPLGWLAGLAAGAAGQNLVIAREGKGRLYYRLALRYAPRSVELAAQDHGFTVARSYQAVDDPADVRQDADGTWHVKAGARVRVRLLLMAPSRRYHVALVDALPAGLEAQNGALLVSRTRAATPDDEVPWFEHQDLGDARVSLFTSELEPGVHAWSYLARATTPGRFIVPPARAEEMYAPETAGRSATDHLTVD